MSEGMTAGEREVRERAAAARRLAGLYTERAAAARRLARRFAGLYTERAARRLAGLYTERAAAARRLAGLYTEEANGLLWSLCSATPLQWSPDPEKQARFLVGFNDGCELLRIARQVAVAPEDAA